MPSFSFFRTTRTDLNSRLPPGAAGEGGTRANARGSAQRRFFFVGKARCSECHMAEGKGGFLANDLTAYGKGRTPAQIRDAITLPEKDQDQHVKLATATTREGKTYRGLVRTEDNFSLVLQTQDGEFVSLQKADLATMSYDSVSMMPKDYGSTLSARELDDLVSYLMSLQSSVDLAAAKKGAKRHWDDEE